MTSLWNSLRIWAQYREFRAIHADLARRSDRQLANMGLGRGDIVAAAYTEAERRVGNIDKRPTRDQTPATWAGHGLQPSR